VPQGNDRKTPHLEVVETSEVPDFPALRDDLVVTQERAGVVIVRTPESQFSFPIYDLEWRAAQWMDGTRDATELAGALTKIGVSVTPELVSSFIREFRGYRFLRTEGSQPKADASTEMSEEERQFIATAKALVTQGKTEEAHGYLIAAKEINPNNATTNGMLRQLGTLAMSAAAPATDDLAGWQNNLPTDTPLGVPEARPVTAPIDPGPTRSPIIMIGALALSGVALAGLALAGVVVWIVLSQTAQDKTNNAASPVDVAKPQPREPAIATHTFQVRLEALKQTPVVSPVAGFVDELLVANGAAVTDGEVLARMLNAAQHQKLVKAKQNVQRLKNRSRRDRVAKYYLGKAVKTMERTKEKLRWREIVSPARGSIRFGSTTTGRKVKKGEECLWVDDTSALKGRVPPNLIAFPLDGATCRVTTGGVVASCQLERGAGVELSVVVRNPQNTLTVDQLIGIVVTR